MPRYIEWDPLLCFKGTIEMTIVYPGIAAQTRSVERAGGNPSDLAVHSLRLLQAGHPRAALTAALDAAALPLIGVAALDLLGTVLSACGDHATALTRERRWMWWLKAFMP
jgi:hypothetical protein